MQKTNQKRSIFPLFLYICPEPVAIKDQVMQDGTTIHQWQFHGSATSRWEFPSASEEEGRKTFDEVVELMYCEHCKEDILTHLIANGHAVS